MRQVLALALLLAPLAGQASAQEAGCCETKAVAKTECSEQAAQAACESTAASCESTAKAVAQTTASKRGWCDRMSSGKAKVASVAVAVPVQDPGCSAPVAAKAKAESCQAATIAVSVPVQDPGACHEAARLTGAKKSAGGSCETAAKSDCGSAEGSCEVATVAVAVQAPEQCSTVKSQADCCDEPASGAKAAAPVAQRIAIESCETAAKSDCDSAKGSCDVATVAVAVQAPEQCSTVKSQADCSDEPASGAKAAAPVAQWIAIESCETAAKSDCDSAKGSCDVATVAIQAPAAGSCSDKATAAAGGDCCSEGATAVSAVKISFESCEEGSADSGCETSCEVVAQVATATPAAGACGEELEAICTTGDAALSVFQVQDQRFEVRAEAEDCGDCDGSDCDDCKGDCEKGAKAQKASKAKLKTKVIKLDGSRFAGPAAPGAEHQVRALRLGGGQAPMTWTQKGSDLCPECAAKKAPAAKRERQIEVIVMGEGDGPHAGYFTPQRNASRGGAAAQGGCGDCEECCGCCAAAPRRQAAHGDHGQMPMMGRMMKARGGQAMGGRMRARAMGQRAGAQAQMMKLHQAHGMAGGMPVGVDVAELHRMLQSGGKGGAQVQMRGMMVGPNGAVTRFGEWQEECEDCEGDDDCGGEECGDCEEACEGAKAEVAVRVEVPQVWIENQECESGPSCEQESAPAAAPQVLRFRAEPASATVKVDRMSEIEKRIIELEMQLVRIESLLDSIANG